MSLINTFTRISRPAARAIWYERRALGLERIGPRDTTIVAIDLEDATEALTSK
jgi:class 3 adenylate cyclase